MTTYSWFPQRMMGVLGGVWLVALIDCSTLLSTHEKDALTGGGAGLGVSALVGGGTGAALGGAAGALGGVTVGDQMQKRDHERYD